MKKLLLLLNLLFFCSCYSQKKISLRQMNDYLMKNNYVYYDLDYFTPSEINGFKISLTNYRLLGAKACGIDIEKKHFSVYVEDGFNKYAEYDGIIIINDENSCEITTNVNKIRIDSLTYTKINTAKSLYAKKIPIDIFKKNYPNEYFRYQVVTNNKVEDLKKCLAIDEYLPKPYIDAKSYYFTNKKINIYEGVRIDYNDVKDGIEGIPYLTKEKEKEFIDCINSLVPKDSQ